MLTWAPSILLAPARLWRAVPVPWLWRRLRAVVSQASTSTRGSIVPADSLHHMVEATAAVDRSRSRVVLMEELAAGMERNPAA